MHRQEDTAGCEARLCAEEAVAGRHEQILTEDGSVTLCVPELHEKPTKIAQSIYLFLQKLLLLLCLFHDVFVLHNYF